ncbi:hypothetical protein Tco_0875298 [Tanacetum coccineum]|uniref:UBN2 domain-containing protein n=1 Tax=Tanacetum coccineum TaxID=301880 RepID=A0ABQ5BRV3_9ASTR
MSAVVVLEKDSEISESKKEKYKSLALKARKVLSEEEATSSDSNDEEYVMAVRDFKKFFRRRGKFVRQPHDDKKNFRKFNTIITSLKALDESFSSRNHARKFLWAFPTKWCPKVMAIEESKDLSTLPLDELIGNLKVYEVVLEKDSEISKSNDQKAFVVGCWSDSEEDKDEICLMTHDINEVLSDTPYYSSSSLDNES